MKYTVLGLLLTVLLPFISLNAVIPFPSYTYNNYSEVKEIGYGYKPLVVYNGDKLGITPLNNPCDLFVSDKGIIYIADTMNDRIIIIDKNFKVQTILTSFLRPDGKEDTFNHPQGLCLSPFGDLFVADTENERIVKFDGSLKVSAIFNRPQTELLPMDQKFRPLKVGVDRYNKIFIVSAGQVEGLIQLTHDGQFKRFFGGSEVKPSLEQMVWRVFLSEKDVAKTKLILPPEYSNLDVVPEGFVYATIQKIEANQVRYLNYFGENIIRHESNRIPPDKYGDLQWERLKAQFVDICADASDNVMALDNYKCRVYMYNFMGDLLFIFGDKGDIEQAGMFKDPVAIDQYMDNVYILDSTKGSITLFQLTEFGQAVLAANKAYMDGKYTESFQQWQKVLKIDSRYTIAYRGLGYCYHRLNQFKDAMNAFRLGDDKSGYSKAFKENRRIVSQQYFSIVFTFLTIMLILLFSALTIRQKILQRKRRLALEEGLEKL